MLAPKPAVRAQAAGSTRDASIDTLKGLACILVVAFHVTGSPSRGLDLAPGGVLTVMSDMLSLVRMPLFTFLTGYVYAMREDGVGPGTSYLANRLRQILVPLVTVSLLYAVVQSLVPGTRVSVDFGEVWRIFVFPYEHFWFLQALAIITVVLFVLETAELLSTLQSWMVCASIAIALRAMPSLANDVFSINAAVGLFPFFLLGLGTRRFSGTLQNPATRNATIAVACAGLSLQAALAVGQIEIGAPARAVLQVVGGGAVCVLLIGARLRWRLLALIGSFSYAIYLFHIFGTAGTRIALSRLGVVDAPVLFVCGIVVGIVLPIMIAKAAAPSRVARLLLLGK